MDSPQRTPISGVDMSGVDISGVEIAARVPSAWFAVLLEGLVAQAPIGIAILDREYRFIRCNDWLAELDGVTVAAHLGRTVAEVLPQSWPSVEPFLERAADGHDTAFEIPMQPEVPPGTGRWWRIAMYPIRDDGGQVHALGVLILDITERKRASAARDDFLNLVSHELRTPLTSIIGFAARLERQADAIDRDELKTDLHVLLDEAERLRSIVQNMLAYASGPSGVPVEPYDIAMIISRAVSRHSVRRSGRIDVDVPEDLPELVGRTVQIEQVLLNLLDNAAKYAPGGRVLVRAERKGDTVRVYVRDSGDSLQHVDAMPLFEPFARSPGTRRLVPGVGLGLSVARRTIEAHGGEIWLRRMDEGGTEAGFSLPVEAPPRRKP